MKNRLYPRILFPTLAMILAISFSACGSSEPVKPGDDPGKTQKAGALSGAIKITASESVQSLLEELGGAYNKIESGVVLDIQPANSTQAVTAVNEGTSDIGAGSRTLSDEEKNSGLTENIIAYGGITVVVNPGNTVSDLTADQIAKIYKGDIKNWNEVGGPDSEILVINREDGAGIRDDFERTLKLQEVKDGQVSSLSRPDALPTDGAGAVKAIVASKDNAIGYVSMTYADDTLKKVSIGGIGCTLETIKDKSYPLSQAFTLITKGQPKPEAKSFIDYILGADGQKIVSGKYAAIK